ncbi:biopolymer transporter ExbD [bacterium]|nr:biopolymer transporter ExbD [bacterium]MBU1754478.1 biopolymer transporter ExbD [bacterium]
MKTFIAENNEQNIICEINITPFTDMFLILLIIFMVATPFLMQEGIKVNLPSSGVSQAQPEGVIVTLTKDSKIFIENEEVTIENLSNILIEKIGKAKEKLVIVRGDKDVVLGIAVNIMDVAKLAGATKIAIATVVTEEEKGLTEVEKPFR